MSLDPLEAMEWCYSENFWEFLRRLLRVDLQFQVSFGKKKNKPNKYLLVVGHDIFNNSNHLKITFFPPKIQDNYFEARALQQRPPGFPKANPSPALWFKTFS